MVKNYEKLTLSNDFVFGKVMENEELCRKVLETLLQTKIDVLNYPQREKSIRLTAEGKPIRLDIYVKDEADIFYDAEMQNKNGKSLEVIALPKRSRYYQALMDGEILKKGIHYHFLSDSYVIFICTFDPFGKGKYVYTFENICIEDRELILNDRTKKVFFNTKSNMKDMPQDIRNLFSYIEDGTVSDELTKELDTEVQKLCKDEGWWAVYMKSVTWEMDARYEGIEIGREEGRLNGIFDVLFSLVKDGIIDTAEAAKRANVSEEEFKTKMEKM